MVVTSLSSIQAYVWIPPTNNTSYILTVTRSDSTVDDVTDTLLSASFVDMVTDGIGNFEFEIPDSDGTYGAVWTGMEVVKLYKDYGSGGTPTLRFRGRMEKVGSHYGNLQCSGRSESFFVADRNVSKNYTDIDSAVILLDLFNVYGGGRFTLTSIPATSGTLLTVRWAETPFWDCVKAICEASGYDCYIDANLIVRYFAQGSNVNLEDAIVHDSNLVDVKDFANDLQFVKNVIKVYGGVIDGQQIIYTSKDSVSISTYGERMEIINDDGIRSSDEARELADYTLSLRKNPPQVGDVISVMLATVAPGDMVQMSSPLDNLPPAYYRVVKIKDEFGGDDYFTTLTVNKEPRILSHVLRDRVVRENQMSATGGNTFGLDFAYTDPFDVSSGTHSNTEVSQGILQVIGSSGYWESDSIPSPNGSNVIYASVLANGDNIPAATFELSADNGINYTVANIGSLLDMGGSTGTLMKLRITFNSSSTRIESFSIQYSTE